MSSIYPKLFDVRVGGSFPKGGDRAGLIALIEGSVDGDALGMGARRTPEGVKIAFPSLVLRAVNPA